MTDQTSPIIVAIDGHSSCGKSTVAREIAARLGYLFIDSGAMYRAVTLYCLRHHIVHEGVVNFPLLMEHLDRIQVAFVLNPETGHRDIWLNGENVESEIRNLAVSQQVSPIAAIAEVRKRLVVLQQELGRSKGIVMDGRDIGTVVFPQAELKIFMTAQPAIRAQRRYEELRARGEQVSFEEILTNVIERDRYDENREQSPLRKADDALILDNSHMTREEQFEWVLDQIAKRTKP